MSEYFLYDFIPAPHTIFTSVKKLPAGHMAIFDRSGIRVSRYWTPPVPETGLNYQTCKTALLDILSDSTDKRLVADVPLGAFLSGGIDSTLITALMSKSARSRVRTFSISFPGTTHDESQWSRLAAESIGSDHTEHRVDFDIENLFTKIVRHFGEPFGDSSAIPTWRLCRETRKSVTVALSGDGGDELFGGYERYLARRLQNIYDCLPKTLREKMIEPLVVKTRATTNYYGFSLTKKLKLFIEASARMRADPLALTPQTYTREEVNLLTGFSYDPGLDPAVAQAEQWLGLDTVTRMMFTDIQTYLAEDILTKVDRMSMAHALEVRSPFLDHRMVEFACRLPLSFKIKGETTKLILRDVAQEWVPTAILKRSKQGFQVPLGEWFKNSLKHWAEQRLFDYDTGLLNKNSIEKIWRDHQNGRSDNTAKIWLILFFNEWKAQFA
jgi:asparagine synthase (glutamine-hydrolysing)